MGAAGGQYLDKFNASKKQMDQLLGQAPVAQPDLSDPNIQAARSAQLLSSQLRRGRASTFAAQAQPDLLGAPVGNKQLLGG